MANHTEHLRQLKQFTILNFSIFAVMLIGIGIVIGRQTEHLALIGLFVGFLVVFGFLCMPVVYRRAQNRLDLFRKS